MTTNNELKIWETRELLFDGDIRGYRTGKDCVLELNNHHLWQDSIKLTKEAIECIQSESDGWIDIVDDVIEKARSLEWKGHTWTLGWEDGSIFAYRDDYQDNE